MSCNGKIASPSSASRQPHASDGNFDFCSIADDETVVEPETVSPPWATIDYYELDSRVGETFECTSTCIHVDGYTNPDLRKHPHRFRLGRLINPKPRSLDVMNVRNQIGGGVRLYYLNGQIYARCATNFAVFVHSTYYNHISGYDPDTICTMNMFQCRIMPLFRDDRFAKWLAEAVGQGSEVVHKLAKMCTIRISFGKGWGKWGKKDPHITSVPCWIEIKLQRQLKVVERALREMGAPNNLHH
ncbi:MH2 domain containing protein [Asbolus verrucosus]|uniref:MH2 domain containing protein n=1 Tax=Asbolus verrucosus TaxID=1661398 RepID=A0A482V9R5_ASBVE|nr:MH2 domain containing protein [Asbolus verrucosus]